MPTSLKTKWQFAVFAALLYLTAPLVNAVYFMIEEARDSYPANADSIGIPIFAFAGFMLALSPFYAVIVWLATYFYRGGLSLFSFNTRRPIWSGFWSLLLGVLVLAALYSAGYSAYQIQPLEVVAALLWSYLLLCLRSSLAGSIHQSAATLTIPDILSEQDNIEGNS